MCISQILAQGFNIVQLMDRSPQGHALKDATSQKLPKTFASKRRQRKSVLIFGSNPNAGSAAATAKAFSQQGPKSSQASFLEARVMLFWSLGVQTISTVARPTVLDHHCRVQVTIVLWCMYD